MNTETLYFLRDVLHDMTLNVSTPDFRHRAQLVINALNDLDDAIMQATTAPEPSYQIGDLPVPADQTQAIPTYGSSY